jgi:hypothetical protein
MASHYTVTKDLYLYIGAWRWLYNNSKHVARVVRKYEGYPESKFRWAIKKKKQEYITNHLYFYLK